MSNNSNQSGALLLMALVLGVVVYALIFFGSSMEQKNMSASFGHIAPASSVSLFSENKKTVAANLSTAENRSDLSGVSLPNFKTKSTSGGNYAQTTNPDFPSTGVNQMDVQNMGEPEVAASKASNNNYARAQTQSYAIGNANVDYISNPQNPTKSDINVLLLLDTRAAESAMSAQQGSKRATPALAAKTASVSTDQTKASSKKIGGDPGEPGAGGSLPVGDGVWLLLLLSLGYGILKRLL